MNSDAQSSLPPDPHLPQNEDSVIPSDGSSPVKPDSTPPPRRASLDINLTVPEIDSTLTHAMNLPRIVGKYVLLEEVLAGGMGVVYKARDTELDRIVALKMIKGGLLATAEEMARFHHEARAAARLGHPNIVPVYETGQEEGRPYFTMAFAWGGSLTQQRGRFITDPRAAVELLEKVARAIHYAHQNDILHRDLKPGNILFDERGNPWVGDFGLAKFVNGSLDLTVSGQLLGTPAYMAPEQASGATDQVSAQTDVWALGVLLYELLTGQRAFKGEGQEEQLRKVRSTEPPRPRTVNRSLDRALERVILKCLEKEPTRRYVSAEALAEDLARWLRGEPVLARPPARLVRAGRAIRRYRTWTLRFTFATIFLMLLALAGKEICPDMIEEGDRRAMEEKVAQSERGEKVTLIGKSGGPVWGKWQPFRTGARTMLGMDKIFRIYAGKQPALFELLPHTPGSYQFRARVQHCGSQGKGNEGQVGIYFAHGKRRTKEGATHCFFKLAFNDRVGIMEPPNGAKDPESQVNLTLPVYREKKGGVFSLQLDTTCVLNRPFTPAGKIESMPWRTLKVEVTPERIKAFWEDEQITTFWGRQLVDSCDPKKPLEWAAFLTGNAPSRHKDEPLKQAVLDMELGLGDGIGLYVERGTAAFQSVVIEPLVQR